MAKDAELEPYFLEAASWDADRTERMARSERKAWFVAAGACTTAVLSIVAIFTMLPLKRVDPFVIRVDNTTGVVDVVPVYEGTTAIPQTVTRYFLNHYVTVCERFTFSTAESDYNECGAFHGPQRNQEWSAAWDRTNPQSPLNTYKDGSTVSIQVTAITFFTRASGTEDLAQVRYIKSKRLAGVGEEQRSYWIATIQYGYAEPSKEPKVRRWNPLGFKVVDFRREVEAMAPAVAVSTSGGRAQ